MFPLKVKDSAGADLTVNLKWGNWAMYRACELASTEKDEKGKTIPLTLPEFFNTLLTGSFDFKTMCVFLQAAAECANRGPVEFTEYDYGDWIDQCGGLLVETGQLAEFAQYVVKATANSVTPLPGDSVETGEKKSQQ